jgi:DHA2 family multidrug resistance protein
MVNFMRNIGSSVGTSVVTTLLARRSQFHQGRLSETASGLNSNFQASINGITQKLVQNGMNLAEAQRHALARYYAGLQAQASTLAYIDTYFVLAASAGAMFLLSFTLRKNNPGRGPKVASH